MRVLKFGGSSLATADRIGRVAEIVRSASAQGDVAIVVSALGGVTDALGEAAEAARRQAGDVAERVARLEQRHVEIARAVADVREHAGLESGIRSLLEDLLELLRGVGLVGEVSARSLDRILASGELLSAPLVAAALRRHGVDALDVDARELIVTDAVHGRARPDAGATRARIQEWLAGGTAVPVVTGFIGATADGATTTLGRGGSDFTASIVAVAVGASAVELWTDVDGVMSADPRMVPDTRPIRRLRYEELMELAHFGAKVVHPPSVHPVRICGIPLWIRSTFEPGGRGTLVSDEPGEPAGQEGPVRGITSIHRVALLRLGGDGMVGVPGVAMRLFGALARSGVNVILITQGSSEHSICFAVAPEDLEAAREVVGDEFEVDRRAGDVDEVYVEDDVAVVAVVGAAMCQRPGIAGRLFSILGERGVNVRAIAQGSSELNISLVVKCEDEARAVRAIHRAFFERPAPAASLFLAGAGGVGGALLDQLEQQRSRLAEESRRDLRLDGIADSKGALVEASGIEPDAARERLRSERGTAGPVSGSAELIEAALSSPSPLRIFVDTTASDDMVGAYRRLLENGVTVVTANKKPLAVEMSQFRKLARAAEAPGAAGFYHEATVGAGLPVVRTLADLLATGDELRRVEGVFSGTASFLSAELARSEPFSTAVARAGELGFTEPDPREDLSGEDVARKLLIVVRMAGMAGGGSEPMGALERGDLEVEPWIPAAPWNEMSPGEFNRRLPELDSGFRSRQRAAAEAGFRLAYLASWDGSRGKVGLTRIAPEHPCFDLAPGENLFAFTTRRYAKMPLVVRGPGAGPEVTAAGVLADVLRAIAERGKRM